MTPTVPQLGGQLAVGHGAGSGLVSPTGGFSAGYRPHLDGVRGIAILLVLLSHIFPRTLASLGPLGVQLFFVLSAYLITMLLIFEHQRNGRVNLKHFYLRRVLRLLPALIATLSLYIVALYALAPFEVKRGAIGSLFGMLYVANFADALHWGMPQALTHLWSLSVEEQFYVMWPCMLVLLLSWRQSILDRISARAVYVAVVVGGVVYPWAMLVTKVDLYFLPTTWNGSLSAGVALAVAKTRKGATYRNGRQRLRAGMLAPISITALTGCAVALSFHFRPFFVLSSIPLTCLLMVILLSALEREDGVWKCILATQPMVSLGRISYGLYLVHLPVLDLAEHVGGERVTVKLAAVAVSVLIAAAMRRFLEQPALRLKARIPAIRAA